MAVVAIVAGALLLGCMIGIAGYAAKTLPPDARIPIHSGLGGNYNNFVSKKAGLISWVGVGALVYVLLIFTSQGVMKPNHATPTVGSALLLGALVVLTATQIGAIKAARGSTTDRSE